MRGRKLICMKMLGKCEQIPRDEKKFHEKIPRESKFDTQKFHDVYRCSHEIKLGDGFQLLYGE